MREDRKSKRLLGRAFEPKILMCTHGAETNAVLKHPYEGGILDPAPSENDLKSCKLLGVQSWENEAALGFSNAGRREVSGGRDNVRMRQAQTPGFGQQPFQKYFAELFPPGCFRRKLVEKRVGHTISQ